MTEINNSKKKIKYILIAELLFIFLLVFSFSVQASRPKSKDARVRADMSQFRTVAEIIYLENNNSYLGLNCDTNRDTTALCNDIEMMAGIKPSIHANEDEYCIYIRLPAVKVSKLWYYKTKEYEKGYFCIDSRASFIQTYIDPGTSGYCDGKTFVCPKEKGTPPPLTFRKMTIKEILIRIGILFGGVIILGINIFFWVRAFKKRREEIGKEDSFDSIKKEIKSKKWFYIWLSSFIFLLIFVFLIPFFIILDIFEQILGILWEEVLSRIFPIIFVLMFILSIVVCGKSKEMFKKSLINKNEAVCWEGYFACFLLGLLIFLISPILLFFFLLQ